MQPTISVCIPVYNSAPFIEACVDSILAQTFQDFEIILVNDGSTDESLEVCQRISGKSPKISLYSTENQGDTRTRGAAASHANGTWVTFVDSDDTLPPTALADLMGGCSEKTDIVVGCHYETNEPARYIPIQQWREILVRSDVVFCSPVARLFRRAILPDSVFSLKTAIRTGTDMPMNIKISFLTNKDVHLINKKVYSYYEHADSLSHSAIWTIQKVSDLYTEVICSLPPDSIKEYMPFLIQNRLISLKNRYLLHTWRGEPIETSPYISQLRQDIQETGYPLNFLQRRSVYHPDSRLTVALFSMRSKAGAVKRFAVRLLK